MPDQSSAAQEHSLLQEITEPLNKLPDDAGPQVADTHFPTVLRGYDKLAVDEYVRETSRLVAELQSRSSPQSAVRRALERVGEDVSGILQRAHDTAEGLTNQSRGEAEDRLEIARREAAQITAEAHDRVKELDNDTDRIWAERDRIVGDARELARHLLELADAAAARFPAAEEPAGAAPGDTDSFAPPAPTRAGDPSLGAEEDVTQAFPPPVAGADVDGHEPDADPTQAFPPFDVESPDRDGLPGELQLEPPPAPDRPPGTGD